MSVKYLLVCFLIVKLPNPLNLDPPNLNMLSISELLIYFRDILYNHLQKSDCFVISFDESLNDYAQNCQMDILIRYFDHVENTVKVRYLDSKFFVHATHEDFFIQFTQALFKLDTKKMFQVSIDGPIVNHKFLERSSFKE